MKLSAEELARAAAMVDRGDVTVMAAGATQLPGASEALSYSALLDRRRTLVRPSRG